MTKKEVQINGMIGIGDGRIVNPWKRLSEKKGRFIPKATKPQGPITPSSEPFDWDCLDPH